MQKFYKINGCLKRILHSAVQSSFTVTIVLNVLNILKKIDKTSVKKEAPYLARVSSTFELSSKQKGRKLGADGMRKDDLWINSLLGTWAPHCGVSVNLADSDVARRDGVTWCPNFGSMVK